MFREMRSKDRELDRSASEEILKTGKYGVLNVLGDDGYPYGMPINYIVIDDSVYFHTTSEPGHLNESLARNNKVSLTVLQMENDIKGKSAILFGTAEHRPDMKAKVLEKFVEDYVPEFAWEQAKSGIPHAIDSIDLNGISIDHISSKWVDKPEGK